MPRVLVDIISVVRATVLHAGSLALAGGTCGQLRVQKEATLCNAEVRLLLLLLLLLVQTSRRLLGGESMRERAVGAPRELADRVRAALTKLSLCCHLCLCEN